MLFSAVIFGLCSLILFPHGAWSYSVDISGGDKRCFLVSAFPGFSCTGSYEIISPDPKPIIVSVNGPSPKNFLHFEAKFNPGEPDKDLSEGSFQFDTDLEGYYSLCFANGDEENNDGASRTVAFNFRAIALGEEDYESSTFRRELVSLKESLYFLKDHQAFMNQREDFHKESLDNINLKVLLWTILEAVILLGMAIWQITYIQGFFETKRRI